MQPRPSRQERRPSSSGAWQREPVCLQCAEGESGRCGAKLFCDDTSRVMTRKGGRGEGGRRCMRLSFSESLVPGRALYTSLCCILLLLAACSDGPLRRHGGRHLGRPGDLLLACAPQGGPLFKYAFSTHSPPPWIVCPCSAFTRPGRRCPGPTFSLASHADCSRHVAAEPWEHAIFGVCGGWWLAHKLLQGEQYYEELTAKIVREKMDRNRGVLDEKYRSLLGDNYSKYFKES